MGYQHILSIVEIQPTYPQHDYRLHAGLLLRASFKMANLVTQHKPVILGHKTIFTIVSPFELGTIKL